MIISTWGFPTRRKKDGRDNYWSDDYSALSNVYIYNIRQYILYDLFFHLPALPLKKKQTFNSLESVTCLDSPILGEVGPSNFGLTWLIILQLFKAGNGTKWFETTNRTSWSLLAALSMPPNTNFGLITKIWMQIPSNTQKQNHTAARQRIPSSSSTQTL